jgi:hypothetical protein
MPVFHDFNAFSAFIASDRNRADIVPVRVINVETMAMWVRIKTFLINNVTDFVRLSDYCEHEDIAPNLNRLKTRLRAVQDNTLVIPLSEYLRINSPLAKKVIEDILHLRIRNEDGKTRLYVLLYRMQDVVSSITTDPRSGNTFISIREGADIDYSLTIVQEDLDFEGHGNEINGFQNYLIYWEQNPDKPIVLKTKTAINYADMVFYDNVKVIVTAFGLLRHAGLPEALKEEYGTEAQWNYLVSRYAGSSGFDATAGSLLGVGRYDDALFGQWRNLDPPSQWVLWLWARLCTKNRYLVAVLNKENDFAEFEEAIYLGILNYDKSPQYKSLYNLRKELLKTMGIVPSSHWLPREEKARMLCLTDNSEKERLAIIKAASAYDSWDDYLNQIRMTYPDLWLYLQPTGFDDPTFEEYFDHYKKCKIRDSVSGDFLRRLDTFAEDRCASVWRLKARNAIVDEYYLENTVVQFVDALGIEYLNNVIGLFSKDIYDVVYDYGYCNLPSTTSNNKDFSADKEHLEPIYELDHWKHSNCSYPASIDRELEIVQSLRRRIEAAFGEYDRVIIAADHGTSRLAVIAKGAAHRAHETARVYKYGRYCIDAVHLYEDIKGCLQFDDFWIFANYDKFKQSGAPRCETHGGATLEEMLVPVICVTRKDRARQAAAKPKISVLTPAVKLPVNREVTIRFTCNPPAETIFARIEGKDVPIKFENGEYFFVYQVKDGKKNYTARLIQHGLIIAEIEFTIIRPMEASGKFDI